MTDPSWERERYADRLESELGAKDQQARQDADTIRRLERENRALRQLLEDRDEAVCQDDCMIHFGPHPRSCSCGAETWNHRAIALGVKF